MKMTYTKSQFEMPDGKYLAKFLGVSLKEDPPGTKPRLGQDGNPLPPAMTWDFEIADGQERGKRADKLTGRIPTPKSGCGKMLAAITDRLLIDKEEVDLDIYVGKIYRITVMENRVTDTPPPVMSDVVPSQSVGPLWDYSDGAIVVQKATTDVVIKFLETLTDLTLIKVRPAGNREQTVSGTDWMKTHAVQAPRTEEVIPF